MQSKIVIRLLSLATLLILSVSFVFAGAPPVYGPASAAAANNLQSNSSCPASDILNFGYDDGAPSSANFLTAGGAGLQVAMLNYLSLYPAFNPSGVPDYNMSIVDWYSTNSNFSQWTFNVKPGLKWSDGTNVSADDIIATYSNKFAFNSTYDFTGAHTEVVSEQKLNSSAVQFNLNKSDAEFGDTIGIQVLTAVYPAAYINQYGPAQNFFNAPSDGPFYISNYTVGSTQMVMKRNPYFHPAPAPCQLDISFVEGLPQVSTLLTGGTVDYGIIDPASAASILATPNLHVMDQKAEAIEDLNYNITTYPFNMTQFRQALVYAINESQVVSQADFGYGLTAYSAEGSIPPTEAFYSANQMKYNYSTTAALNLLHTIGFTGGGSPSTPLKYSNGTTVSITLWGENSEPGAALATGVVASNLQNLGITINEHVTTFSDIYGMKKVQPDTMYLVANTGAVFPDPLVDILPGWDVYEIPPVPSQYWEYPPSAQAQYQSNVTALESTGNTTLVNQYIDNIQALNAQYLPNIVVGYEDSTWGYSTARWTNWPSYPQHWFHVASIPDDTLFSLISPVGTTSSSSSTGTISNTGSGSTTTPISTTSSTGNGGSSVALGLPAVLVILIVVTVGLGLFIAKRREERAGE